MHHLLVVRHAKSDWRDPSLGDHDRPLAARGVGALPRMEAHLTGRHDVDVVLCSSARRTLDTLTGIRAALPDHVDVRVEDALYGADAPSLLARLRQLDEDVGTALIVGHNPGLHDLVLALVGDGDDGERARLETKFPTGAIATLSFDATWAELEPGRARLDGLFTPRRAG